MNLSNGYGVDAAVRIYGDYWGVVSIAIPGRDDYEVAGDWGLGGA